MAKKPNEFQPGNQLWKARSSHGRPLLIQSPFLLWQAAIEYFEYCDTHPLNTKDWVGKDAWEVVKGAPHPYTIRGFCIFIGANTHWWSEFKSSKTVTEWQSEDEEDDFSTVIARIDDICYEQKYAGAAVGWYRESMISKDLGLRDKVDLDHSTKGERLPPPVQTIIRWGDKDIPV